MVNDFNGFDKGVIGKKLPSDSTLNNMKKADLIKLLHTAEHNHTVLAQFYKNAVDNSKCHRCPLIKTGKNKDDIENLKIQVERYDKGYIDGSYKAIDDFSKSVKELYPLYVPAGIEFNGDFHKEIDEIAERLKGGGKSGE